MTFDNHVNFGYAIVLTSPSPAVSGTTLTLQMGQGALLPTPPFNGVAWPFASQPSAVNAEIVRVTNITGDVLTITRAQENSTAQPIAATYQFSAAITAKTITDIETATGSGGTSALTPTAPQTSGTYAASVGDLVLVDLSAASVTIQLPNAPADKKQVAWKVVRYASPNILTVQTQGSDVLEVPGGSASATPGVVLDVAKTYQYEASTHVWLAISGDAPLGQLDARYIKIASPSTYGAAAWSGSAWESDLPSAVDICAEFGVSTSLADNSTAINTALSTLGPLGLTAFISKPGVYAIKSPIIIGNGTTSTFSTWSAILMGAGMPGNANVTGNGTGTVQTMIQWAGSSGGSPMIEVQGPLTGWGLRNLAIDGGSTSLPSFGLSVTSGVRGRIDNVAISNTQSGIQLTTLASRSGALAAVVCDTIMNLFYNVSINYIGKTGQKSFGIILQSGLTSAGNSCYNEFDGLWITPPNTSFGGATINYNIYFQGCDSNLIRNWTSDPSTGTDTHWATFWDYSQINIWPAGNVIDKVDFATLSSSSTGSPSTAGTIGANSIINISAVNGQPGNPHLPNVRWGNNTYNGSVALSSGTATVTACQTVQAGSFIRLSVVPAGTPGNVVVTSRSTGTFTITSYQPGTTTTQTTDTSTIFWEVLNDSKF